jgi:hypothetical protein
VIGLVTRAGFSGVTPSAESMNKKEAVPSAADSPRPALWKRPKSWARIYRNERRPHQVRLWKARLDKLQATLPPIEGAGPGSALVNPCHCDRHSGARR